MTRYNQFLCVIGLTLMVGCTDCSTTATPTSDATTPAEPPISNVTTPAEPSVSDATVSEKPPVSIPEIPDESCGDGMNGGVWEGDVTTEEELFAAKYCIEINGSVLLENSSSITGIDFPVLERIVGVSEVLASDTDGSAGICVAVVAQSVQPTIKVKPITHRN